MFVVTGGSSGIGRALAENLAARKKHVLIIGRNEEALNEISSSSEYIKAHRSDLSTKKGRSSFKSVLKNEQNIEGFVNCAGMIYPIMPLATLDEEGWRSILEINLTSAFLLIQCLREKLIGRRVMQIGSRLSYYPVASVAPYCVSKVAVSTLIKCWRIECPEIEFASILPGFVDTPTMTRARDSKNISREQHELLNNLKKEGLLISTKTVASFLTWLLLDVEKERYISKEWDIYDTSHHKEWLVAPNKVPLWDMKP
jgi:benzil reductase ((S)-benzoin forming)